MRRISICWLLTTWTSPMPKRWWKRRWRRRNQVCYKTQQSSRWIYVMRAPKLLLSSDEHCKIREFSWNNKIYRRNSVFCLFFNIWRREICTFNMQAGSFYLCEALTWWINLFSFDSVKNRYNSCVFQENTLPLHQRLTNVWHSVIESYG